MINLHHLPFCFSQLCYKEFECKYCDTRWAGLQHWEIWKPGHGIHPRPDSGVQEKAIKPFRIHMPKYLFWLLCFPPFSNVNLCPGRWSLAHRKIEWAKYVCTKQDRISKEHIHMLPSPVHFSCQKNSTDSDFFTIGACIQLNGEKRSLLSRAGPRIPVECQETQPSKPLMLLAGSVFKMLFFQHEAAMN